VKDSRSREVTSKTTMAAAATAPAPGYGTENSPPEEAAPIPWRQNLNDVIICKDCKEFPPNLIEDNADLICATCGLVQDARLVSYESEWRTFNSDEGKGDDPNRVGEAENELLNNTGSSTTIAGGGPNASKETRRLQRAQAAQTSDKANKALMVAYKQIDAWADEAELMGNVRQAAKMYYKRVDDAKAFKGKSQDAIMAGCIFIACRQCKTPRTFTEIFGLTRVPKKEIGRIYKSLEKFLTEVHDEKIKAIEADGGIIDKAANQYKGTLASKPTDLCARYCNMLGLNFRVQSISQALAEKIPSIESLAGRSPLSNAAACIYFASNLLGQKTPSKDISQVASVSDATIKHAYKLLLVERDRLVEPSWLGPQQAGGVKMEGKIDNLPFS
jgi:transcription initiation factor TFIIB